MRLIHVTRAGAVSLLLTATLAACAGGGSEDEPDAQAAAPDGPVLRQGPVPGAVGEVAAVRGRTAQVQSEMSGQVAVSWTDDTTFTEEVDGTLDDVVVGSCVVVVEDTVRVTDACDQPRERPSDLPSDLPTDLPSDLPTDRPEQAMATVGEVTAVGDTGFTVATVGDEEVDVDVTDATTITTTVAASADAVAVGRCVSAQGASDDTGAVTAESIAVSDPVDGQCGAGGLMMRGPRP